MPTFGWIYEDAIDARYEVSLPDSSYREEPIFSCQFCTSSFPTKSALFDHINGQHRLERPLILLNGSEAAERTTVRTILDEKDIVVTNTSLVNLSVNAGKPRQVSPSEIVKFLASSTEVEVKLELINKINNVQVTSRYGLSFRIANLEQLKNVESAFIEILVSTALSLNLIDRFQEDERTQGPGKEYANGLASYCLGILVKEQPAGELLTTHSSRYREHYGRANEILKDIQRPMAHLITHLTRFSMNDFGVCEHRTGYWELDLTTELLLEPNSNDLPTKNDAAARIQVCPVDHGTGRILELASKLFRQARWSPILDDECRALANSSVLDSNDHQKAFATWAAVAWRMGAKQSAIEPLKEISGVYPFDRWAKNYLESQAT